MVKSATPNTYKQTVYPILTFVALWIIGGFFVEHLLNKVMALISTGILKT